MFFFLKMGLLFFSFYFGIIGSLPSVIFLKHIKKKKCSNVPVGIIIKISQTVFVFFGTALCKIVLMPVSWETDACFFVAFHLIPRILRHLISFIFYILLSFYLFECAVPQHLYFCALNFWCMYISFCAKAERPFKISWHERYDTTRSKTLNLELLRLFCLMCENSTISPLVDLGLRTQHELQFPRCCSFYTFSK